MILESIPYAVPMPRMAAARQTFRHPELDDIPGAVHLEITASQLSARIKPGARIAITAGSRGIANISLILRSIVDAVRHLGGEPFLLSAMGSHGGNTVEGQQAILDSYGITEASMGAPVICNTETRKVGTLQDGTDIYTDTIAAETDGVIVVNRVKPHTEFRGPTESGLIKMIVIGLGRERGASMIHRRGFHGMKAIMPQAGTLLMQHLPICLGIGIIENGYARTAQIAAVEPDAFPEREKELLVQSRLLYPKLLIDELDVLIVDEMGKNISGSGLDPGIIGRRRIACEQEPERPRINRLVVCDLTDGSHGNAVGLGLADVISKRLYDKIDYTPWYINSLTSNMIDRAKIPMIGRSDRVAVEIALKTCWADRVEEARVMRIKNTNSIEHVEISEFLIPQARETDIEMLSDASPMAFDDHDTLMPIRASSISQLS